MDRDEIGLPELCYVFIPGNSPGKRIGIVKRDESGYHPTDYDTTTAPAELAREHVRYCNDKLEVDEPTEKAMYIGSLFGWHVPAAQPQKQYQDFATRAGYTVSRNTTNPALAGLYQFDGPNGTDGVGYEGRTVWQAAYRHMVAIQKAKALVTPTT